MSFSRNGALANAKLTTEFCCLVAPNERRMWISTGYGVEAVANRFALWRDPRQAHHSAFQAAGFCRRNQRGRKCNCGCPSLRPSRRARRSKLRAGACSHRTYPARFLPTTSVAFDRGRAFHSRLDCHLEATLLDGQFHINFDDCGRARRRSPPILFGAPRTTSSYLVGSAVRPLPPLPRGVTT